jgi:hypothetical protein
MERNPRPMGHIAGRAELQQGRRDDIEFIEEQSVFRSGAPSNRSVCQPHALDGATDKLRTRIVAIHVVDHRLELM